MGADLAEEEQFGPYLVYERLGVGGMATVHRALERGIEGFERIVALKRLLPHLAEDASFIKSFVREAKLASLLNHVNIVQIYELGRVGTEYFISMEYIDGRDIRRILRHARKVTGPPPIHVTVGLLLQLCEALDYAHTKADDAGKPLGLIHRDVSPSNLLITKGGHLKVIDFGIAKAQSSQLRTQTGRVKGKLAYMAPEAVGGKDLDSRSDLFAAGVIAHELLTARPLFASKNEYQTLLKVQRGDIMPPSTFNQACPSELDAIVLKALARDPDERFASAAQLRDDLLELRRRYNLQSGHRDVAQWLEWAFTLEPPSGGFAAAYTLDQTGSGTPSSLFPLQAPVSFGAVGATAARPRRDDDEAVEIAWGGGEQEQNGAPIVLEDVPDVSGKHLAASASGSLTTAPRTAAGELADDGADELPAAPASASRRIATGVTPTVSIPAGLGPRDRRSGGIRDARGTTDAERTTGDPGDSSELAAGNTMPALGALAGPMRFHEPSEPRDLPSLDRGVASGTAFDHGAFDAGSFERGSSPRTNPRRTPSAPVLGDGDLDAVPAGQRPNHSGSIPTIGAALVARQPERRTWLMFVGLVAAGALATVVALYATRDRATDPEVTERPAIQPGRTMGTVKFVTEPADAEITIEGRPTKKGSPWATELAAGVHQIQIHREGYKAWLTSLELSAAETQTLRVVLEPLASAATGGDATLILSSTPSGLEVVLDGRLLETRTPLKMPLRPGAHTVVLRQNGTDVWRNDLVAKPNADYEFSPSMAADKQRERAARDNTPARVTTAVVVAPDAAPPPPSEPTRGSGDKGVDRGERTAERPSTPGSSLIKLPSIPIPTSPAPGAAPSTNPAGPGSGSAQLATQVKPPPPAAPQPPRGPVTVAPNAVTRIGGTTPSIDKARRDDIPAVLAAKVCIDPAGRVNKVNVMTDLPYDTLNQLSRALQTWRYKPYQQGGAAVSACFVVSFRVK